MSAQLKRYLQQYAQWPEGALDQFVASFKSKKLKRGQYVLRAGEVCRDFIFLESGCVRYFLPSEIELTVWIAFPGYLGSEVQSFISEQPSRFFLQAIEPVELLILPKSALLAFYQTVPPSQEMIRRIWEEGIVHIIDRMIALQCESAEKRYLDLIRDPAYLQMIPQKYLASYLGVTPSSLSRLRRKIR
jgi:CRP-like cAMP-binding protein